MAGIKSDVSMSKYDTFKLNMALHEDMKVAFIHEPFST